MTNRACTSTVGEVPRRIGAAGGLDVTQQNDTLPAGAVSRRLIEFGAALARDIGASAMLVSAGVAGTCEATGSLLADQPFHTILVTHGAVVHAASLFAQVNIPELHLTRAGEVKAALLIGLARGLLKRGDRVVCLSGIDGADSLDALLVLTLGTELEVFGAFDAEMLGPDVKPEVFERLITLATQLAVEGREGRAVGALFVLGDSQRVLPQTSALVLNPFHGYPESERNVLDPRLEETIKEFSAIDGAFVIRGDGVVLAAGLHLLATQPAVDLPKGLGTRHAAAAAITAATDAVAIAISQSTGIVTVFREGKLLACLPRATGGNHMGG
jgi:diadenylate cyclase